MRNEIENKIPWQLIAERFVEKIGVENFCAEATEKIKCIKEQILNSIAHQNTTNEEVSATDAREIFVACSGGADSVAVTLLLWKLLAGVREKITILHFNHRTRKECEVEAEFVRNLAQELGVHFELGERVLENGNEDPKMLSEAELRAARLRFFTDVRERSEGTSYIVQGHHADDVMESILMRLGRGSGTAGLAAPRAVHNFFIRPLLTLRKIEITTALVEAGGTWCEDSTNAEDFHLRNRIRHNVVPAWENAQGSGISGGVMRSRRLLEEDDAALETWAKRCWLRGEFAEVKTHSKKVQTAQKVFDWEKMFSEPIAVQRRVFWLALAKFVPNAKPESALVDAIVNDLKNRRPFQRSIAAGVAFVFDGKILSTKPTLHSAVSFSEAEDSAVWNSQLPENGAVFWGSNGRVELTRKTLRADDLRDIFAKKFSPEQTVFLRFGNSHLALLRVRTWRAGDAYRVLGAAGRRNISDMFIDRKIPQEIRHCLPVIYEECSGAILWVPGFPPAHEYRLLGTEGECWQLTWFPAEHLLT